MQLLCQLVEGHLVLGEVRLIVGAILGPLLPEVLCVPRGVGSGGAIRRRTLGKVQAAVFVDAGTQQALGFHQLRRRQHGYAEAVLYIAAQNRLRCASLQKRQELRRLSCTAAAVRVGQRPQRVGLDETHTAALCQGAPRPCRPLAVGDAAPRPAEVPVQQLLRPVDQLLLIQLGGEGQLVQQGGLPVVLRMGLPQYPGCPDAAQRRDLPGVAALTALRQQAAGVLPPQRLQRRTAGGLLFIDGVLQPQPENVAVQPALRLLLKGMEHGLEAGKVVVPAGKTHHRVQVQLRVAALVEGRLLRLHIVAPCAVPDLVDRPAVL